MRCCCSGDLQQQNNKLAPAEADWQQALKENMGFETTWCHFQIVHLCYMEFNQVGSCKNHPTKFDFSSRQWHREYVYEILNWNSIVNWSHAPEIMQMDSLTSWIQYNLTHTKFMGQGNWYTKLQ